MKNKIGLILSILIVFLFTHCCNNDESYSPLVGTSWECLEEPELLFFIDNHSGVLYGKGATDGIYDAVYSSFDMTYHIIGNHVTIHVYFSKIDSVYDFVIEDENTMTCGVFHYKKIQHK